MNKHKEMNEQVLAMRRTFPEFESLKILNTNNVFAAKKPYCQPVYMWRSSDITTLLGYENWHEFDEVFQMVYVHCANNKIFIPENIALTGLVFDVSKPDFLLTRYGCFLVLLSVDKTKTNASRLMKHLNKMFKPIEYYVEKEIFNDPEFQRFRALPKSQILEKVAEIVRININQI